MKRNLIALALASVFASAAYAQPTLTGDDVWNHAPEATAYQGSVNQASQAVQSDTNTYGQNGIYSFNP